MEGRRAAQPLCKLPTFLFHQSPSPFIYGLSCASVCDVAKQKLKQNHITPSLLFMMLITNFRNCFISHDMILVEPEYISLSVL